MFTPPSILHRMSYPLPPEYGPCTLELTHDTTYRDEAPFTIARVVITITLDGFFHTGSAMFLPFRPARGGFVAPRPFDDQSALFEYFGVEPEFFNRPIRVPECEPIETVGLSLLGHVLGECGGSHGQRRLILAGHTNASGADAVNDELSDARARCVWSLLKGDPDGFEAALEDHWLIEDVYALLRYCARTFIWDCHPGPPRSKADDRYHDAVQGFQRSYNQTFDANIDVDGKVGPQTRRAFFDLSDGARRSC